MGRDCLSLSRKFFQSGIFKLSKLVFFNPGFLQLEAVVDEILGAVLEFLDHVTRVLQADQLEEIM